MIKVKLKISVCFYGLKTAVWIGWIAWKDSMKIATFSNRKEKIMTQMKSVIKTERLILRPWQQEDVESFAKMNADIHVMEHFP